MEKMKHSELVDEVVRRGLETAVMARMTFDQVSDAAEELYGVGLGPVNEISTEFLETTFETGMVTVLRDGDVVLLGLDEGASASGYIKKAIKELADVKVLRVKTSGLFQVLRGEK